MKSDQELDKVLREIADVLDRNKVTPDECDRLLLALEQLNESQKKK